MIRDKQSARYNAGYITHLFIFISVFFSQPFIANCHARENIVWVWDNAQPPSSVKHVAIVVEHLLLKDAEMLHKGRKTSPDLAPDVKVTPVIHIEVDLLHRPEVPEQFSNQIIEAVVKAAKYSSSGWVQLDYEAPPSHEQFYQRLIHDLRKILTPHTKLSVTTLAWWCSSHQRLSTLDADEIVPMFFRMGKDSEKVRNMLVNRPELLHPQCTGKSAGFAMQEFPESKVLSRYQRVYWFDYKRWKGQSFEYS